MNVAPSWRLGFLLPAFLAATVGGTLAIPSAVRADCGDYVHMPAAADAPLQKTHSIPEDSSPAPKERHGPCPGPNCSSQGGLPLLPPASPPTTVQEQWGCMIGLVVPSQLNLSL